MATWKCMVKFAWKPVVLGLLQGAVIGLILRFI